MNSPQTSVHIDRLIVDGIAGLDTARLETGIRDELARLIANNGVDAHAQSRAHFDAGAIETRGVNDVGIGQRVARAAYAALRIPA